MLILNKKIMKKLNILSLVLIGIINSTLVGVELPDANSALKPPPTDSKPVVIGVPTRIGGDITILPIDDKPALPGDSLQDELDSNPFTDYKSEYENLLNENKALATKLSDVTSQLTKLETESANSISTLQKKITKLESDLKASQDEVRRNFESLMSANNAKASLSNDNALLVQTIAELTQQVSNPGLPFNGWIYSPDMGWCFVSPTTMPYIYVNDRGWAYYKAGTSPREFFFYDKEQWELHE
jgi:hypothetical protein